MAAATTRTASPARERMGPYGSMTPHAARPTDARRRAGRGVRGRGRVVFAGQRCAQRRRSPRRPGGGSFRPYWWLAALVAGSLALAWAFRLSSDRARPLFFSAVILLPWLPVPLPAALLLWTGPFVWLVWAAIAAAVLTAGGAPAAGFSRVRASLASPARAPWLAFRRAPRLSTTRPPGGWRRSSPAATSRTT